MNGFALSERWNGWTNVEAVLEAARAAAAAGPFDPLVCAVTMEWDFDTFTLDSLEAAEDALRDGAEPMSMEVWIAHEIESEAGLALVYNGRWLQINGSGTDWLRARQAYEAAHLELTITAGIKRIHLPKPPPDAVQNKRRGPDYRTGT